MIPFLSSWGRASKGPPLPVPAHEAWCMAQQRWQPASAASTPPLPRVRSIGMPADPLVPSAPFTAGVSRRNAPTTTYSVHLAVSRETHSEPSRWYSNSTDRIALPRPRGQPDTPMQGRVFPIRLKESGNLLHGSVPSDDTQRMTSGALRTSVLRVRACMRSHVVFIARQRTGSSPGERSEHPIPARQYEPLRALALLPPSESERERSFSDSLRVSRETCPAQAQHSCTCSVRPEEPSGLLLSPVPTGNALHNPRASH